MFFFGWGYLLYVALPIMVLSFLASSWVKRTYQRYSQVRNSSGQTGVDVARRILSGAGLDDVTIQVIDGELSDNYDPKTKTLNLSREVALGTSVAAEAVVAHEIGHAAVVFQLITTPVELNASRRALRLLTDNGAIYPEEQEGARRMLRAAAFTYWVALFGAILTLLYYASLVLGNRRSN